MKDKILNPLFTIFSEIQNPKDIISILYDNQNIEFKKNNKKVSYANIPVSFDIEVSSFYENEEKRAIMYGWSFGFNGRTIIGRTWDEYFHLLDTIQQFYDLNNEKRIIIYVHNLAYEFQFLCKRHNWKNVFALDPRKPVKANTVEGFEYRCSYVLSGYSLEQLGKNLHKYKVRKMVGDLNYHLIRHAETPLTAKELGYMANDVRVVMAYIQEQIENCGNILKIPLTKTGFVRNACRKSCLYSSRTEDKYNNKWHKYRRLMNVLTMDPETYTLLNEAFQGGFTHGSAYWQGKNMYHVESYDFTSSYPTVMLSEKFPMSKGEKIKIINKEDFEKNIKAYCCLFRVRITNICAKLFFEHPLSASKCRNIIAATEDNGRIVRADILETTLTEQDYLILSKFYSWDRLEVGTFYRFRKSYLPTDFIKSILNFYNNKTKLKGVEGEEINYMIAKEMLNSCYGMSVTNPCRNIDSYNNDSGWTSEAPNIDESIEKYNADKRRFLFYPWGIWVTAYARRNLFTGIYEFKYDYIYSDTDSLKVINKSKHEEYIKKYNENIINKLYAAMDFHKLPRNLIEPENIKGNKKPMGVWDDEGEYQIFKFLGAKRYMTLQNGKLGITVSGLNKKITSEYLANKFGKYGAFEHFNDSLYIPEAYTGKNIHTYIDEECSGTVKDYLGNYYNYNELSAVHMCGCDYSLSIGQKYAEYLLNINDFERW